MKISAGARETLKILKNSNYIGYIVGGAVRDDLLGKTPQDYDIATNALPEENMVIFEKYIKSTSGIKHGTIGIYIKKEYIELTTFRKECEYLDFRHPENVEFVNDMKIDAKRRDFTINAIYYNKKYFDYFDGIKDIKNKIIRCVGNPDERFTEDSLRMIRAIRFSIMLGFTIEENTKKSIFKNKELLVYPSRERINIELVKIITSHKFSNYLLDYFEIFKIVIPLLFSIKTDEINSLINSLSRSEVFLTNNIHVVKLLLILYYLNRSFNDNIDANIKQFKEIKLSKKTTILMIKILRIYFLYLSNNNISMIQLLMNNKFEEIYLSLILLYSLEIIDLSQMNKYYEELSLCEKQCHNLRMLNFNGNDVLKIKKISGSKIKKVLNTLLMKVVNEEIQNDFDLLQIECIKLLEEENEETQED